MFMFWREVMLNVFSRVRYMLKTHYKSHSRGQAMYQCGVNPLTLKALN